MILLTQIMRKNNIYENLKNKKSLPLLNKEELKEIQKPINKSIYKNNNNLNVIKKNNPSDILECEICGNKYRRAHKSAHKKTKLHIAYDNMNKKLFTLMINN